MGSRYDQLTLEERCAIAELHRAGRSIRQIAAAVDREPSTISRELRRNTGSGPSSGASEPLPKRLRRSLTFDNGTEFAEHHRLRIKTFFCDPHAPWQKGGVENAVGRIRRWLPRQTNLEDLDPNDVLNAAVAYNHTPRRCLDFQTPAEVFSKLWHFKWESTSRLSPG